MYISGSTTFQMKMGEAATTTEIGSTVAYIDCSADGATYTAQVQQQASNGTSLVDICNGTPGGTVTRTIKSVAIVNTDTVAHIIFILYGSANLIKVTALAVGESLHYEDGRGWYVLDVNGGSKGVGATGATGATGAAGAGASDGDKGDITISGGGTVYNIDADTVGPTELIDTAVTPGSYTNANITVDQQGRLTAAASGQVQTFTVGGTITGLTAVPTWYKVAVVFGDYATAGLTNNINLVVVPAGAVVHAAKLKHSVAFTGGIISSYTLSVGTAGNVVGFCGAFNVFQAAGALVYGTQNSIAGGTPNTVQLLSNTGTTQVTSNAISTAGNLNAATAGAAEIWLLLSAAA